MNLTFTNDVKCKIKFNLMRQQLFWMKAKHLLGSGKMNGFEICIPPMRRKGFTLVLT